MFKRIYKFYRRNFHSINVTIIGLLIGLSFVFLGIFRTLFLIFCMLVGNYVGKKIQKDKDFIKNLLDKILPPGSYR